MRVLKFGGTSMGDEHTWRQVLDILSGYRRPFVVVSATARTTRQLLKAAHTALEDQGRAFELASRIRQRHRGLILNFLNDASQADSKIRETCLQWIEKQDTELKNLLAAIHEAGELGPQTNDAVAAVGERLSSYLFAHCGRVQGLPLCWVDAGEVIRTNANFGKAEPDTLFIARSAAEQYEALAPNGIPVMGGFYGQDNTGRTTTLGFEGSDYSASLVGAALNAEAIEIWTDVSGIYTCDPRVVREARPIPDISYQQATELAFFGAKVLHPSTTKPAFQKDIPIWVKNIFSPEDAGTRIASEVSQNGRAKAMTFKKEVAILTITSANTVMGYEFLAAIFNTLKNRELAVDVVTTTEASLSIAVEMNNCIDDLKTELQSLGKVEVIGRQGIISLIGCESGQTKQLTNDVLEGTGGETVNLISFSRSKKNLNVVLNQQQITAAVRKIHRRIFL